jgi:hypothetical protein
VTVVAVPDATVVRAAKATQNGTLLVALGGPARAAFETSWRSEHFEGVPTAGD